MAAIREERRGQRRLGDPRAVLRRAGPIAFSGAVSGVTDLAIDIEDRLGALEVGGRVEIETVSEALVAEVVGVRDGGAIAMPFGDVAGVRRGAPVFFRSPSATVAPSAAWLGRIVDGLGRAADGRGAVPAFGPLRDVRSNPPLAALRDRLGLRVDFGVKALNAFCPARAGQRLGIFSGSGVGKSTLLSMIARNTRADVNVIALIGERGRELREFVEDSLGPKGLARSVVIVATSDEPAMMRREAAFLAMTVAESFRDSGAHVLCLMDSLTRVASAQREIGLAAGEPPTAKGYTPSVFSLLPRLLERAGPGLEGTGAVTGVFSVLVEGDDHDEPIADAARALLDGHIVLDRRIAERGRFPAVNILKTVSRAAQGVLTRDEFELARAARALASDYEDVREMLKIGAYVPGANPMTDAAIDYHPRLEALLAQEEDRAASVEETFAALRAITLAVSPSQAA
ncbi:MAG: FliI/YscN family ATPase [Parvularculaceae bacterium]|nr:FliI/YscN family ATPase [Parvularculaceae bacterium]